MLLKLYLIRHPKPEIAAGICYGQTDLAVNEVHCQSVASALMLHLPVGLQLISSPLQRCLSLTQLLASNFQQVFNTDDRLKEMHFGAWEMRCWEQIPRDEIDQWAADVVHYTPPQGESAFQVASRVIEFLNSLKSTFQTQESTEAAKIGIIAHAGTIGLILAYENDISAENLVLKMLKNQTKIDFGACIIFEIECL